MARRFPAIVLSLILAVSLPAVAQPIPTAPARKVLDWIDAALVPDAMPVERGHAMTANVVKFMSAGGDVRVVIGEKASRTRSARMAATFRGQLYAFDLTPSQARATGTSPTGIQVESHPRLDNDFPMAEPRPFRLSNLRVETPSPLISSHEIRLALDVVGLGPVQGGSLIAKIVYRPGSYSATQIVRLEPVPDNGVVRFTLGTLNAAETNVKFGPVPVFVEVMFDIAGKHSIASNGAVTLLDVQPDLHGIARSSMALLGEFIEIMAMIQNRASGQKAVEDFKQLAIQNEELAQVGARLTPTKAQDDEIDRIYGARLNALAARMQSELDRLERTDYGREFLGLVKKQ